MKILLINKYLYPKGGDAISTLATGKLLADKGHSVLFWGMDHPKNPYYQYEKLFPSYVDYSKLNMVSDKIKASVNLIYSFEAKNKIEKLINIEKPDIVHLNNFAHQISPSVLDVFDKYRIPMVLTMRDYKLVCPTYSMLSDGHACEKCKGGRYYWCFIKKCTKRSYSKSLLNTLEMYLHHNVLHVYDKMNLIIATSRFLKDKHMEMGLRSKIVILPNFIDTQHYLPEFQWKKESMVYFGRLSEEKGLLTLINAVAGLDIQLKIIGDGDMRQELEQKVKREGLKNVVFLGYKSGDELRNEVKSSMVTVLPSVCYETFGRTIIESFALGKSVIGSRIGGIPELVVDGKTGFTFQPGNAADLRDKIISYKENPAMAIEMGINARRLVEKEFNAEKHYAKLMEIYQMVLNKQ